MRILVSGGTGFVGTYLSGALCRRGDLVTVLTRHAAAARRKVGEHIRAVSWTPEAQASGSKRWSHKTHSSISPTRWQRSVHIEHLVGSVLACIDDDTICRAENVTSPNPVTNAELSRGLAAVLGRRRAMRVCRRRR